MTGTTTFMRDRKSTKKFVSDRGPKFKTNLKDKKVEANIHGSKDTGVFKFFSTIGQLLDPTPEDNSEVEPLLEGVGDTEDGETE
jgi:hypothetical protein